MTNKHSLIMLLSTLFLIQRLTCSLYTFKEPPEIDEAPSVVYNIDANLFDDPCFLSDLSKFVNDRLDNYESNSTKKDELTSKESEILSHMPKNTGDISRIQIFKQENVAKNMSVNKRKALDSIDYQSKTIKLEKNAELISNCVYIGKVECCTSCNPTESTVDGCVEAKNTKYILNGCQTYENTTSVDTTTSIDSNFCTEEQPLDNIFSQCHSASLLHNVINSILYYRFNISYLFTFFFGRNEKRREKLINNAVTQLLSELTTIFIDFAAECSDTDQIFSEHLFNYSEYNSLKQDETMLLEEGKRPICLRRYWLLKTEISRIRNFNKGLTNQRSARLINTSFDIFKKRLKTLIGSNYVVEQYLCMILALAKPLYNLSIFFDRAQNNLLHKLLATSTHKFTKSVYYNQNIESHHLFHWIFFWGFSLSNYNLFDFLNIQFIKKEDAANIPYAFFIHCIIIFHNICYYDQQNYTLYLDNILFLNTWEVNILTMLSKTSYNNIFSNLEDILLRLKQTIDKTYEHKYLSTPMPGYLKLLRLREDNDQISSELSVITTFFIEKMLHIAQETYSKTAIEFTKYT